MKTFSILLGKTIRALTRLKKTGGSAYPGWVIERFDPEFLGQVLSKLPYGVAVISGTNGKTTTTKAVTEILEQNGLKVFTNNTGSNFVRGVISAILKDIKITGKFDYDIAVLELDEAHAVKFAEVAPIHYSLLLNVQRDQLDRFGEIDYTATLLQKIATATKKTVILNREDPRVGVIKAKNVAYFGLEPELVDEFPSDDNLLEKSAKISSKASKNPALVTLAKLKNSSATYKIGSQFYDTKLSLKGIFNAYNVAGALALAHTILPDKSAEDLLKPLPNIKSAFGRGEILKVGNTELEILLVKNPSAFQLSLASFVDNQHDYMIAINDNIADGRDVSWLWNVDFSKLKNVQIVSGIRATDMALRLKYDNVECGAIEEDLEKAIHKFAKSGDRKKRIFATYTAMLEIRKIISGKSLL